ncbi:MAG: Uma2 family endonuclease [Thermoguttaceae bacterium]|jgi:Uma2 family endonuclease
MSVAAVQGENRVVLSNVTWATFQALLAETDRRGTRFTYDRGALEIMSPSREHERIKTLLGRMIETTTLEWGIPVSSGGSTTLKSELKQRGVEPDECYYIANEPRIRGREEIDLATDPPPDLAVEVDLTSSSLDQLGIYGALGVPEVWLCDGAVIHVYQLQVDGTYARQSRSDSFPLLPLEPLERFLQRRNTTDETTLIREFHAWVRGIER